MFYIDNVLTRKGPLANIWMAAHWDKKLNKAQIVQTDIESSVKEIVTGALPPMALRLSGQLLLGVTKIYGRKAVYLLEDCSTALSRLRLSFKVANVDLPAGAGRAISHSITIPEVAVLEDALTFEHELDLEALLKESASQVPNHSQKSVFGGQQLRRANLDYEAGRMNFGLGTAKEDELPSEFLMDIDSPRRDNLLRQSIEVGRRAESPRPSLPFSPLRTPRKEDGSALDMPNELVPMNDDLMFSGLLTPDIEEAKLRRVSDVPENLVGSPVGTTVKLRTIRNLPDKRRTIPLDDETELVSAEIQEQVRDPSCILVKRPNWSDVFLADSLSMLSLKLPRIPVPSEQPAHVTDQSGPKDPFAQAAILEEEIVPMNDDYMLEPTDYMPGDYAAPPEPKSPRIASDAAGDENVVPAFNEVSPQHTLAKTRVPVPATGTLAENSLSTITHWKTVLTGGKSVSLEKLIAAPGQKKQAAEAFIQLLILHTKGLVRAEQAVPFGTISVKPLQSLFAAEESIL